MDIYTYLKYVLLVKDKHFALNLPLIEFVLEIFILFLMGMMTNVTVWNSLRDQVWVVQLRPAMITSLFTTVSEKGHLLLIEVFSFHMIWSETATEYIGKVTSVVNVHSVFTGPDWELQQHALRMAGSEAGIGGDMAVGFLGKCVMLEHLFCLILFKRTFSLLTQCIQMYFSY